MHLLFCFCQSNAHPNFKNAGHIGGTALGQICGTKKDGQACRLTISRKVLSCGRNGHTAPLISQESSTKNEVAPCSLHPPCVYFSRFLCGEQLTQDFAFPTAHTPLDAWRKPFYNRPSDCCFRFAYSVALLIPITKRPSHPRASAW